MPMPGVLSGLNHSLEIQAWGRTRSPLCASSSWRVSRQSSSQVPWTVTFRSLSRTSSSSSSGSEAQGNFAPNFPADFARGMGLQTGTQIDLGRRELAQEHLAQTRPGTNQIFYRAVGRLSRLLAMYMARRSESGRLGAQAPAAGLRPPRRNRTRTTPSAVIGGVPSSEHASTCRKGPLSNGLFTKRRLVMAITERLARGGYGEQQWTWENPMLTTMFRQTRGMISEWRCRARERRELAMLGGLDRHDLARRFNLQAEMRKPFWQA